MRQRVSYEQWKNMSTDESDYLIYDMLYEILERLDDSGIKRIIIPKPQPRPQPRQTSINTTKEYTSPDLEAKIAELETKLSNLNRKEK